MTSPTPAADRPADLLRAAVAWALVRYDWNAGLSGRDTPSEHHYGEADAVLAALPAPALAVARQLLGTTVAEGVTPSADRRDRYAAAMALRDGHPEWPVRYEDDERDYRRRADAAMAVADAEVVQAMRAMHDTKEEEREAHRLALSEALGLGTGAPWDAIRDRAAELAAVPPAPADRAATRDRIRRAICEASGFTWLPDELLEPDEYGDHADAVLAALADGAAAGVQPPTTSEALTDAERQFLTFAMDLAFNEMVSNDGFTDEDEAALEKFRALAAPPAAPAAPEELQP